MKKLPILIIAFLCQQFVFAQVPSYVPTSGLRAWYPFSGNTGDSSGYARHGVSSGGVAYGSDRFGMPNSCFVADSLSAVNYPTHLFPLGDSARTVSVFFKLDNPSAGGRRELFAWGDNSASGNRFGVEMAFDTGIGWEAAGSEILTKFKKDTNWHNITVSYPAAGGGTDSIRLYLDGHKAAVSSVVAPLSMLSTVSGPIHCAGSLFLGPGYLYGWYGKLDDIGVWNRELTSCEVEKLYYAPASLKPVITAAGSVLKADTIYTTYQWIKNGTSIPGATGKTYTYTGPGSYKVAVVTKGGCADTSLVYSAPLNVHGSYVADALHLFPNPATDRLTIAGAELSHVSVYNMLGQELFSNLYYGETEATIDIRALAPGMYILRVNDAVVKRFIKE